MRHMSVKSRLVFKRVGTGIGGLFGDFLWNLTFIFERYVSRVVADDVLTLGLIALYRTWQQFSPSPLPLGSSQNALTCSTPGALVSSPSNFLCGRKVLLFSIMEAVLLLWIILGIMTHSPLTCHANVLINPEKGLQELKAFQYYFLNVQFAQKEAWFKQENHDYFFTSVL